MAEHTKYFDIHEFLKKNELHDTPEAREEPVAPDPVPEQPARRREPSFSAEKEWRLQGFHGRARVATNFGSLPIMGLRRGDRVKTMEGIYKKVEWLDEVGLDEGFLLSCPEAQPMEFSRNAFGPKYPEEPFLISPSQQFLLPQSARSLKSGPVTPREVSAWQGVRRASQSFMSYYLFHCGAEDFICVEGVWCRVSP